MKKILITAIAAILITASFASCYDPDAGVRGKGGESATIAETTAGSTKETKPKKKVVSDKKYEDNFEGLRDFMKDSGYIKTDDKNNITKMQANLIGAEKGYKYADGDTRVELYSFNLKAENDTRDKVIESVKKDGSFTLYSETIPAYLSDNGKYLMVYTNPAADDKNSDAYKTKQNAIKAFKGFKADSEEKADSKEEKSDNKEKSDTKETTAKKDKK